MIASWSATDFWKVSHQLWGAWEAQPSNGDNITAIWSIFKENDVFPVQSFV